MDRSGCRDHGAYRVIGGRFVVDGAARWFKLLFLLAGLAAVLGGCIMEDRVVDVVIGDSTCAGWYENHTSFDYTNSVILDYTEQMSRVLRDNDLSRGDIASAHLVRMTYGVTQFSNDHDWLVTGAVTVRRNDTPDGPFTLFDYVELSVEGALGRNLPVALEEAGVGVINRALDDFIAGGSPVLVFEVDNSGVTPSPSVVDPIQFSWCCCIYIQVIHAVDVEVPDPF